MNTDKLMELERKWRAEAKEQDIKAENSKTEYSVAAHESAAYELRACADELAALRAEQAVGGDGRLPCPLGDACVGRDCNKCGNFTPAKPKTHEVKAVGDEQRARELLAECLEELNATAHGPVLEGSLRDRITRALGAARQSKFGVVPPPNPAAMVKAAYKAEAMRTARQSEGMVLVPREPTYEMLLAGDIAAGSPNGSLTKPIYNAMIAAAPGGEGEG